MCRLSPHNSVSMHNILMSRIYFFAHIDIKKTTSSLKFAIHYSHYAYLNADT